MFLVVTDVVNCKMPLFFNKNSVKKAKLDADYNRHVRNW